MFQETIRCWMKWIEMYQERWRVSTPVACLEYKNNKTFLKALNGWINRSIDLVYEYFIYSAQYHHHNQNIYSVSLVFFSESRWLKQYISIRMMMNEELAAWDEDGLRVRRQVQGGGSGSWAKKVEWGRALARLSRVGLSWAELSVCWAEENE